MISRVPKCEIIKRLKSKILILDGAMGTMIQSESLSIDDFRGYAGNNDILNITRPDIIGKIHKAYIEAGADIIETNTFSSTAVSQQEYGCADIIYDLNLEGARIARRAAEDAKIAQGREVLVAGSMGPTIKMLSFSPDVNRPEYRSIDFATMVEAYKEQVGGLLDGGVDLLLVETVYDGLNAKAALYAIEKVQQEKGSDVPVMVSATVNDRSGRLLSGQMTDALFTTLSHYDILSFGLNCSFGAAELMPFMEQLANGAFGGKGIPCFLSIYPNAGLPNEMGQYDELPEFTAAHLKEMAQKGLVNIAGGCCGTTPEHIRAIKEALADVAPRRVDMPCSGVAVGKKSEVNNDLWVSGLENLLINKSKNNFINVGERTNVAGSAKFAKLIRSKEYAQAADIARKQIEEGATIIDINMDDAMLESAREMETFVRYISNDPDIAKVPFMIDSSDWETIMAGLKNSPGKCIVNSLSLKEGEEEFLRRAKEIYLLGAAVIVMAFDEEGQAVTYKRKIEICERAYNLLTRKVGFLPEDIIFDVNVLTIATGLEEHNDYAVDFIKAVAWIKENLPGCKTSGGVSNLSFAFRGNNRVREAMHSVFLYHAIKAGLDMAIVNPGMLQVYDEIEPQLLKRVEAVVLNDASPLNGNAGAGSQDGKFQLPSPTDVLIEMAQQLKEEEMALKALKESGTDIPQKEEPWREKSLEERLAYALVKGITSHMQEDISQALEKYVNPVEIIEGPLMEGMDRVGNLFSEGKMFLPQVVKSAKAMKVAVTILEPEIEKYNELNSGSGKRGKVILATAKGDVHDIGKNIVAIVLACNNFEVIDLGVMVDNAVILEEAIRHKADIIGISGLITPSLEQMENLCKLLEENKERIEKEVGHKIVLSVGGATTSAVHTAVKLAPLYSHCVVYGSDASRTAGIYKRLMQDIVAEESADSKYGTYISSIKDEQKELRDLYYGKKSDDLSIEEARELAAEYSMESFLQPKGYGENNLFVANLNVNELLPFVDWTQFFNFWGFKGVYPNVLYTSNGSGQQAEELFQQAMDTIAGISVNDEFQVSAMVKFFDAYSENEEIVVVENYTEDDEEDGNDSYISATVLAEKLIERGDRKEICRFKMPRQLKSGSEHMSGADYFPKTPYTSKLGMLVVKVEDKRAAEFDHKDYEYLLRQSLCARFAEAMAQWTTAQVAMEQNIIRVAFGYSMSPDHSQKKTVFDITDALSKMKMEITGSYAIKPSTSICALLIAHPKAKYF